ncbi:MAG: hypothetical protein RIS64_3707 [Bacteroidota bacterium]|jgi:hypothetical protein
MQIFTGLVRMFIVQNPYQSYENLCNPYFHEPNLDSLIASKYLYVTI